ncbi:MAG: aryl-sulfate sulfotransferase [Promethearchaeota archaeon]
MRKLHGLNLDHTVLLSRLGKGASSVGVVLFMIAYFTVLRLMFAPQGDCSDPYDYCYGYGYGYGYLPEGIRWLNTLGLAGTVLIATGASLHLIFKFHIFISTRGIFKKNGMTYTSTSMAISIIIHFSWITILLCTSAISYFMTFISGGLLAGILALTGSTMEVKLWNRFQEIFLGGKKSNKVLFLTLIPSAGQLLSIIFLSRKGKKIIAIIKKGNYSKTLQSLGKTREGRSKKGIVKNFRTSVALGLILLSGVMMISSLFSARYIMYNDGELLPDGNFMICQYEIVRHSNDAQRGDKDAIIFVNPAGEVVRSIGKPEVPLDQPHEALVKPDGNILIANCRNDTIIEVNDSGNQVWIYDLRTINWTTVDPAFTSASLVNNPRGDDWSHVNDVDYEVRNGTEYLLISTRNFDMVFEINYSSAKKYNITVESDITWFFGEPGNHTMLNHQHNADYLSNGNIIVADSENQRIVEINYTSRTISWVSPPSLDLYWVRDADENPWNDEVLLITDSLHHRVIEYNKTSESILWSYSGSMIQPYQADYVAEDEVIIADGAGGRVFLINTSTSNIIRSYSAPNGSVHYARIVFFYYITIPVGDLAILFGSRKFLNREWKERKFLISIAISTSILCFFLVSILYPQWFLKLIVQGINLLVR